jgi:hypothetical protein
MDAGRLGTFMLYIKLFKNHVHGTDTFTLQARRITVHFLLKKNLFIFNSNFKEGEENASIKFKKFGDLSQCNIDQIMEIINEKLTTGLNGVKHLFKSNDLSETGRLNKYLFLFIMLMIVNVKTQWKILSSRESFKAVLNQLCGYISGEAWNKIVNK